MNIKIGNYDVLLEIVYKNNRNIYFRFNDKLNLVVTCPKYTSNREIFSLIDKNKDALIKMYEKNLNRKKEDEEFTLFGKKYIVMFTPDIDDVSINGEYIYVKNEDALKKYVNEEMERVFKEEVDICKNCFSKLPEFKLVFRKMKTRWGVCNRYLKKITLNTELVKKRTEIIDYVIIHEMSHFFEGNHSKAFWDIVGQACPNYKALRKELKK